GADLPWERVWWGEAGVGICPPHSPSPAAGLWSLTYEQELTTPLHITAGRGYLDCLQHLLLRGAAVDLAPGGTTALHEACAAARTDCARLLLSFGADPTSVSEAGHQPLHLCKSPASIQCAKLLLQYGASVNSPTEEEEDTALHVAARHGLEEHVQLFLSHGAGLEAKNEEGQTPLNAACAQAHPAQDMERYHRVCQQLVQSGASVEAADRDQQRPLHQACKNASARVVELLLAHGANVNIMSYSGNTAMHNILQVAAYKLGHRPELVVRALLNRGAIRIWPGALVKVGSCLGAGCDRSGSPPGGRAPSPSRGLVPCLSSLLLPSNWGPLTPGASVWVPFPGWAAD
ncbi:ankyrin repeat and SOCS box-containing 10, partial [Chelydra serpentina]